MRPNLKRKLVAAFKPHSEGLLKLFGSLEADIMEIVWNHPAISARDVFEHIRAQGQLISHGAVKTVLDRLVKKQVLTRTDGANSYVYRAVCSREEFSSSAVREVLNGLLNGFGQPVYAAFVEQIQQADPEQLQHLAQLIQDAETRKTEEL